MNGSPICKKRQVCIGVRDWGAYRSKIDGFAFSRTLIRELSCNAIVLLGGFDSKTPAHTNLTVFMFDARRCKPAVFWHTEGFSMRADANQLFFGIEAPSG
ncbi:MAG: hypothetical protein SOW20_07805 [Berryella intestinalis]|uniref:hypothetical protein n=1 Tax=Berryella intestinalis TaxID=1531429 RepID=UPI002A4FA8D8|nr:hypothetical protein [Berryella intestinalis]MDD7369419.1 hypothetical protein [Berryella intestinalis]MDY3129908.1 hypothetical protein [Berryella intestinalis]